MTIAALALEKGITSAALAVTVGVDPRLFEAIDYGYQGLPMQLVPAMATALATDHATVMQAAGRLVRSNHPAGLVPLTPQITKLIYSMN